MSALFVVFEGGMPLIGVAVGAPLTRTIDPVADYPAVVAALIGWAPRYCWRAATARNGVPRG